MAFSGCIDQRLRRVAFGCSAALRNTLAPDRSSVTFSSKVDLAGHWVVVGERVSAAVKTLPSRDSKRINEIDDGVFVCVGQMLSNKLGVDCLLEPKTVQSDVTKLFSVVD
jgi:hypothetical protein